MMDNPPRTIPLFCWILDVSDRSFSVSIDDTQTVDNLKKAIVKEKSNTLANIEADQLTLWKVSSTFHIGHTILITLAQGVYPDWHYSDNQE